MTKNEKTALVLLIFFGVISGIFILASFSGLLGLINPILWSLFGIAALGIITGTLTTAGFIRLGYSIKKNADDIKLIENVKLNEQKTPDNKEKQEKLEDKICVGEGAPECPCLPPSIVAVSKLAKKISGTNTPVTTPTKKKAPPIPDRKKRIKTEELLQNHVTSTINPTKEKDQKKSEDKICVDVAVSNTPITTPTKKEAPLLSDNKNQTKLQNKQPMEVNKQLENKDDEWGKEDNTNDNDGWGEEDNTNDNDENNESKYSPDSMHKFRTNSFNFFKLLTEKEKNGSNRYHIYSEKEFTENFSKLKETKILKVFAIKGSDNKYLKVGKIDPGGEYEHYSLEEPVSKIEDKKLSTWNQFYEKNKKSIEEKNEDIIEKEESNVRLELDIAKRKIFITRKRKNKNIGDKDEKNDNEIVKKLAILGLLPSSHVNKPEEIENKDNCQKKKTKIKSKTLVIPKNKDADLKKILHERRLSINPEEEIFKEDLSAAPGSFTSL